MGIFYGLLASIGQALAYTYAKKSYQKLPPSVVFFFDACFGLILWIPFALFLGVSLTSLPEVMFFALASALLAEAFVFYALSKGPLSISGTIFASYPIYTIFFSFFINNERLTLMHWFFVGLTVAGIILCCLPKRLKRSELKKKLYILWPLLAAIAVGFSDSLSKNIIDKHSPQTFLFALSLAQIPVALSYLKLEKQPISQFKHTLKRLNKYKFALLGSFFNVAAVLFMWLAFAATMASIISPLTATYPVLIVALAIIILKEKPTAKELAGIMITLIGVVGISFFYSESNMG